MRGYAVARSATDIQADLDAAYAARRAAYKAQSYSLDTGQGRQQVTRVDLRALDESIMSLEEELEDAQGPGTLITGTFSR